MLIFNYYNKLETFNTFVLYFTIQNLFKHIPEFYTKIGTKYILIIVLKWVCKILFTIKQFIHER